MSWLAGTSVLGHPDLLHHLTDIYHLLHLNRYSYLDAAYIEGHSGTKTRTY